MSLDSYTWSATRPVAIWTAAVAFLAVNPTLDNLNRLLVAAAVTVTLRAALDRRDCRLAEYTRLAYWAGTVAHEASSDAP